MIEIAVDEKKWAEKVFWTCAAIIAAIALMDIFFNYYRLIPFRLLRRVFNITREDALGNWFSSLLALAAALTLLLIFLDASPRKRGWAFLSAFFGYIAIDDATRFHERAGVALESWAGAETLSAISPSYPWHVMFLPLFGLAGLYILYFLWAELRNTVWFRQIIWAFVLFAAAVGLDFLEGLDLILWKSYTASHFQKLIEESLEMLGTTFFLTAFLGRLTQGKKKIVIT